MAKTDLKRLEKRIKGYEKESDLYSFALENKGKVFAGRDLVDRFEYVDTIKFGGYPTLLTSRMGKYINLISHHRGERRYIQIRDVIWIPKVKVKELDHAKRLPPGQFSLKSGKDFAWIERALVPFWLLQEYGGPLRDDAYLYRLRSLVRIN